MTDTSIAQAEPVLVALDIAKARHEVLIAVPGKKRGKKRRRRPAVLTRLDDFNRLLARLYALHAPEVDGISKGKARVRYEFGTRVSIATTIGGGVRGLRRWHAVPAGAPL